MSKPVVKNSTFYYANSFLNYFHGLEILILFNNDTYIKQNPTLASRSLKNTVWLHLLVGLYSTTVTYFWRKRFVEPSATGSPRLF